jgi:hypothetical protein
MNISYLYTSLVETVADTYTCSTVKADSHIACRAHAAPMPFPCLAVC